MVSLEKCSINYLQILQSTFITTSFPHWKSRINEVKMSPTSLESPFSVFMSWKFKISKALLQVAYWSRVASRLCTVQGKPQPK